MDQFDSTLGILQSNEVVTCVRLGGQVELFMTCSNCLRSHYSIIEYLIRKTCKGSDVGR